MFWVSGLIPPSIEIEAITPVVPATTPATSLVTTAQNHNLVTGMTETIFGVQGTGVFPTINGQPFVVAVPTIGAQPSLNTFTIPFDSSPVGSAYQSGGSVTPNPIVEQVTISDYPDAYLINYAVPAVETVEITVTWQTDSPNYVSADAVAAAAGPALLDYINGLPAGTTPINVYDMTAIFLDSISNIMPAEAVTVLNFAVSIDGFGYAPAPGTGVIYGDENSYFLTTLAQIIINEVLVA
jgi:hypothetical protein